MNRRGRQVAVRRAVDDEPESQYLYPEPDVPAVVRGRRLLSDRRRGALDARADGLYCGDASIDWSTTVTDLPPSHAAACRACEHDLAVVAPPTTHALGDKRCLAWLRDESLLIEAGLDVERAYLLSAIPPTRSTSEHADDFGNRKTSSSQSTVTAARRPTAATSLRVRLSNT